jgi:hypothetical protein
MQGLKIDASYTRHVRFQRVISSYTYMIDRGKKRLTKDKKNFSAWKLIIYQKG